MKPSLSHFIIAVIVSSVSLTGYVLWYGVITAMSAEVGSLQNKIDSSNESASRIASARSALAEIAGDESAVQSYFVSQDGVVDFIDYLQKRGQSLGTTVSVSSVSAASAGTQSKLTLSLSVNGTFDAVMRTVGAIEFAPYDLSLSSLLIGRSDKNSWHADLQVTVGSVPIPSTSTSTPSAASTTTSSPKTPVEPIKPVSPQPKTSVPTGTQKGTPTPTS